MMKCRNCSKQAPILIATNIPHVVHDIKFDPMLGFLLQYLKEWPHKPDNSDIVGLL